MKAANKNSAQDSIKKAQLSQAIHLRIKRRVFTLGFEAAAVRQRKGENLSTAAGSHPPDTAV